jgi:hypothetical protein
MLVDAAGAAKLQWRIEQQQHWRQAKAVADGRQPAIDPDSDDLASLGDGIRIYSERHTNQGRLYLCKRLVDGVWEHGTFDPAEEHVVLVPPLEQPVGAEPHVAHVA